MLSYADLVREELLEMATKRPCCKKALACGLLLTAAAEDGMISVVYRHAATAEFAAKEPIWGICTIFIPIYKFFHDIITINLSCFSYAIQRRKRHTAII